MNISFDFIPRNLGATLMIAALSLSIGWTMGRHQVDQPADVREQLVEEIHHNQEMLDECFLNMKNQFTPGYKSYMVFDRLKSGKPRVRLTQGEIFHTQCATNLAVNGAGFFIVREGDQDHYTRDGRFSFQDGKLKLEASDALLLGFELDIKGNLVSIEPKPMELSMDPKTKLYGGKYTGFHFDETGKLYGESTATDPVTGQTCTGSTPLLQVALANFGSSTLLTHSRSSPTLLVYEGSGQPALGVAGQGANGAICPGSLELANVDFMEEGYAIGALRSYAGLLYGVGEGPAHAYVPQPSPPPMPQSLSNLANGGLPTGFYENSAPMLRRRSTR